MLVAAGHDPLAIGDYPLDRFLLYVASAGRASASRRHDAVVDMMAAVNGVLAGKKSGVTAFLSELKNIAGEGGDG